jgi:hypothetical protein
MPYFARESGAFEKILQAATDKGDAEEGSMRFETLDSRVETK